MYVTIRQPNVKSIEMHGKLKREKEIFGSVTSAWICFFILYDKYVYKADYLAFV